ncbi:Mobile element protein [Methanosarcina siciliae C2J]|uniref:Mobile element protein n=1 Tax=Methanosarcina siciliae C2J TaxID=1434118 RepID=A0A0E3PJT2_9EURY|nr:Mobile element protein [Methanosarcina siciliae C2J]
MFFRYLGDGFKLPTRNSEEPRLFDTFNDFFQLLRYHNVSYDGISDLMDFIFPRSRSTIFRAFYKEME